MTYDVTQEATLRAFAEENGTITYADAVDFHDEFGKSTRSVISKIKSLDLPYTPKPVPVKRPQGLTKAQVVDLIANATNTDVAVLAGLDKATASALSNLLTAVS